MRVYLDDCGEKRLTGRANIPADVGPVCEVPLFGAVSVIRERFTVGTVAHLPPGGSEPTVERAVLLAPGQIAELQPGGSR